MYTKYLIEFGLSEKEAKIYVALLELEIATVNEVAKKAGLNRSSSYVVLEQLTKKGMVSTSNDKKVLQYIATSPEFLLKNAEDAASKQNNIIKNLNKIVPELKALHKDTKSRPKVRVFEGKNGLIQTFEDSLNSSEKMIRISSSISGILKILPEYFPLYVSKRNKLGIKMHGIHPDDDENRQLMKMLPRGIDLPVLIPKKKTWFPADLAIYDNKIAYMSAEQGGMAVIIESREMASIMKNIFDLAFEEAKRISKKK